MTTEARPMTAAQYKAEIERLKAELARYESVDVEQDTPTQEVRDRVKDSPGFAQPGVDRRKVRSIIEKLLDARRALKVRTEEFRQAEESRVLNATLLDESYGRIRTLEAERDQARREALEEVIKIAEAEDWPRLRAMVRALAAKEKE